MHEKTLIQKIQSAFLRQGFPYDLLLVVGWLAAAIFAIYVPVLNETPFRIILALPVILFIPGYWIILALFPKESDIDLTERLVLSICVSIAVVPLIGLGLNFTPWGIRLDPIVITIAIFTLGIMLVAHYLRARLPQEEQFRMPFTALADSIREEILPAGPRTRDRLLGAVLAFAIIIALLTTIYMITVPREGEQFTEFFILDENRTATNFPRDLITGQNYPMYVSIGNHENRQITYTIETWMLFSYFDNVTSNYRIKTMDPGYRLSLSLMPNQTAIIPYNLSVNKTEYNRVEFLLFDENVPGFETATSDRINASYRDLHMRIEVWERQDPEDQVDITG
ncbi:MAG: DUF1616 domain-containing protein [Methanoregula sp.]|nr:DUF1616 domain-containing protein [Methanoregula sp.]